MSVIRLLLISATFGPTILFAQGPQVAVKAGLNLSTLYNNEEPDGTSRAGLNIGLMGRSRPDLPIGAQVELLYSAKGRENHYEGFLGVVDQNVDFNLNYLEVPAMVSFRLAGGTFELQAGVYGAYLLNAKVTTDGDLGDGSDEVDRDNLQAFDAGLVGGAAINMGPLQLGARYNYGLTSIAKGEPAETLLGDAKNACAQFYLAFGLEAHK